MSTVQQIIDGGIVKCAAARPESFESPAEFVSEVGLALRTVFQTLARENPYLLGQVVQVTYSGGIGGWQRPNNSLRVIRVVADVTTTRVAVPALAAGAEINVVPFDDQDCAEGLPSLTEFGQVMIPTGQTVDPSGGTLTVYYVKAPTMPTAASDNVDPLFPSVFDDYLMWAVAAYAAQKDQRVEDMSLCYSKMGAILNQMIDWARAQVYELVQRHPMVTPPLTNTAGGRQQPLAGS